MSDASDRLHGVKAGIAAAAKAASRDPSEIALIAISKGRSSAEVERLIAAGHRHFGENRVQEAQDKWPALRARFPDVRLHFIGRLQSNKAVEAVQLFDVIHSVDRISLVGALAAAAVHAKRGPTIYIQVNIGEEDQKGGCAIDEVPTMVAATHAAGLTLAGLMAIPPLATEPAPFFALLAKIAEREGLNGLSMGMSGDYKEAVMLGSTAVRVGRALFEAE